MNLDDAIRSVKEFHRLVGAPVAERPTLLHGDPNAARELATTLAALATRTLEIGMSGDVLMLRTGLAIEELSEWLVAHADGDIPAAADAWADRAYVLLGDAVATGLPAGSLFAAVHASNATKSPAPSGDGKAVKGSGYVPPDIDGALRKPRT